MMNPEGQAGSESSSWSAPRLCPTSWAKVMADSALLAGICRAKITVGCAVVNRKQKCHSHNGAVHLRHLASLSLTPWLSKVVNPVFQVL